jgi:phosphate transport system permease protein
MASAEPIQPTRVAAPQRRGRGRRSPLRSWRTRDQLTFIFAWGVGLLLCLIAASIVIFFIVEGFQYLRPSLLVTHPAASDSQAGSGGFLDAIEGTLILAAIGICLATPMGVITAVWTAEYARPRWLARAVESSVEIIAGTPDIVFAIFGLALFQLGIFEWASFRSSGGGVFGRSFIAAGTMLSLLALPAIFTATRNGLRATPRQLREASYALGKTRIATIRRVLLPAVRRDIATGATLGLGRIIGSTAIVIVLLGATLRTTPESGGPLGLLRGTGSTLTSYIFGNSPSGDGNAPQKAYAAAAVLLLIVLLLNWGVGRVARIGGPPLHKPKRRLGA